tara:strand:+ start:1271 stop:2119 length:849 start_codon:yes stop_codon:yes gene_type:complete
MIKHPSTMLDAFKCLLGAMAPKEMDKSWHDRMTRLLYSYGFTIEEYLERSPKSAKRIEEANWVLDALLSGASRSGELENKGISDRGLNGDFSAIKSIIKIENSMISGSECRMDLSTESIDKIESYFHPWMGGRWTKLAIVILSILRDCPDTESELEANLEWLTIPKNLPPSDYVRVLPVQFRGNISLDVNPSITVSLYDDTVVKSHWDRSMHEFTLELESSTGENSVLERMVHNLDYPLWISISKPLPMWTDKEDKYHIPKFHWNLLNNKDNLYHLQPREGS